MSQQDDRIFDEDPFAARKEPKKDTAPEPTVVNRFHARSDVDTSTIAQHHSLGDKANQASPGDHTHDGRSSKLLLKGTTFTGAVGTYNATTFRQVLAALEKLGALDNTT